MLFNFGKAASIDGPGRPAKSQATGRYWRFLRLPQPWRIEASRALSATGDVEGFELPSARRLRAAPPPPANCEGFEKGIIRERHFRPRLVLWRTPRKQERNESGRRHFRCARRKCDPRSQPLLSPESGLLDWPLRWKETHHNVGRAQRGLLDRSKRRRQMESYRKHIALKPPR